MNGVHDLGGMHGFGAIVREVNEPPFHAAWEGRVRAFERILCSELGIYTIDAFRYGIERMAPADYLRSSYYERWLASIESNLIEQGVISSHDLDARIDLLQLNPDALPRRGDTVPPPAPTAPLATTPPAPLFSVGDAVVTRNVHPTGHTRLPRYARGKRGEIERFHGAQAFPDTNAVGLGEQPQPLYSVRFAARELWGETAEANETVSLELWQSYLEPAPD